MAEILIPQEIPPQFPDHTQLPESDGTLVKNFQEHPQSLILTDSIAPVLQLSRSETRESGKPGKFWVYEQVMRIPYYGIYLISQGELEVYHLVDTTYQRMAPNEWGHYPIAPMQVELGVWRGTFLHNPEQPWLRWWDEQGNLLLTGREQADQEASLPTSSKAA